MRDPETVIAAKAAEDPAFRDKVHESIQLHGLQEHPGWLALREHFENGKEGFGKELTASLMRGDPVDQRDIDYMRGCQEMAEVIFRYPKVALSNLERTARRLMEKEFEEEVALHAMESPYIDGGRDA